jgi:hypothetical protein
MRNLPVIAEAYVQLLMHDLFMWRRDLAALHHHIRTFATREIAAIPMSTAVVTESFNIACAFYPKQALCLQRSAVLVKMLRRRGLPARLMIGAQKLPFKAHAWVQVYDVIIDDRLASSETFMVLEVC